MKKIWVVNDGGHPYYIAQKDLSEEVELVTLTEGSVNPFAVDRHIADFSRALGSLSKKEDYLLLSGPPILNGIALALWLTLHPIAHLLIWDAKDRLYVLRVIERTLLADQLEKSLF